MQTFSRLDDDRLRRLIRAGRSLLLERDLERVLERLLDVARELTGARYAAIGVLDERREGLADFITSGLHPEVQAAISELPRGRGVLGLLLANPAPLRIANVAGHAHFYGFPPGHPPMRSFLGTPILIDAEAWGNLYLTDKQLDTEFDEADEASAIVLSRWAAAAVDNTRRNRDPEQRQAEFEQSVRALQATVEIARTVAGETRLTTTLARIAERSRALVNASAVAILLEDAGALMVAAHAGEIPGRIAGARVPKAGSIAAHVLASGRPERVSESSVQVERWMRELGLEMRGAIFAPLQFRGVDLGVIGALDRIDGPQFRAADEPVLLAAGECVATAVATADPTERERLRRPLQAVEHDQQPASRPLDEERLLQALGSLRVALLAARRQADLAAWQRTGGEAIEQLERQIADLRTMIADRWASGSR